MTIGILSRSSLLTVSSIRNGGSMFAVTVYEGLELPSGLSATPSPASTITSTPRTSSSNRSFEAFHMYSMSSLTRLQPPRLIDPAYVEAAYVHSHPHEPLGKGGTDHTRSPHDQNPHAAVWRSKIK